MFAQFCTAPNSALRIKIPQVDSQVIFQAYNVLAEIGKKFASHPPESML